VRPCPGIFHQVSLLRLTVYPGAAFPDAWLPDDVRELLADLAQGGYVDADVTMLASQLLAKYSQQAHLG
jgi:hypothetical protein